MFPLWSLGIFLLYGGSRAQLSLKIFVHRHVVTHQISLKVTNQHENRPIVFMPWNKNDQMDFKSLVPRATLCLCVFPLSTFHSTFHPPLFTYHHHILFNPLPKKCCVYLFTYLFTNTVFRPILTNSCFDALVSYSLHLCLLCCCKKKKKKDRFLRQWHKHMQPLRGKGRSCKLCFAGETHLSLAAWTAWQSKARPHPESHPTCVKPLLSLELGHWCTQDLCFPACPYSIPYCSLLYCV